mgnify:CR=1 FL=1
MLEDIRSELARLEAAEIDVALDDEFVPEVGTVVRISHDPAYWHMLPERFLQLLEKLPDGAGAEEVHRAIEEQGVGVWHGPSPEIPRDTSR